MSSTGNRTGNPFHISGVVPSLTVKADMGPIRTEVGIGALMPWAGRLWMVTYLSNRIKSGGGTGLYEIDESFNMRRHPESVEGCFANRMMHGASDQIIIGPHVIDTKGNVSTMEQLKKWRLTATAAHLEDPENKFYCVAMDGKFWEVDIHTLDSKLLFDLTEELDIEAVDPLSAKGNRDFGSQPHFKGAYTGNGRVVVTNNTYAESDFLGGTTDGRLAEWDGDTWRILERAPFNEVAGHEMGTRAMFATGWDRASAILEVFVGGSWTRYRLPKGSCTYDWYTATEWPRIREVEHERLLMDCHGIFYELSPYTYDGKVWGITPICNHLRVVPDFCSWQGLLVFGGDHATPRRDGYILAGAPQSGLWFGKTDDLWRFGKPQGWGGPWCHTPVEAGEASDPYLMTGFDQKVMHFQHDADQTVTFIIEVDFLGVQRWCEYAAIQVPSGGYEHHVFPSGFSAHWIRVVCDTACKTTVQLTYT